MKPGQVTRSFNIRRASRYAVEPGGKAQVDRPRPSASRLRGFADRPRRRRSVEGHISIAPATSEGHVDQALAGRSGLGAGNSDSLHWLTVLIKEALVDTVRRPKMSSHASRRTPIIKCGSSSGFCRPWRRSWRPTWRHCLVCMLEVRRLESCSGIGIGSMRQSKRSLNRLECAVRTEEPNSRGGSRGRTATRAFPLFSYLVFTPSRRRRTLTLWSSASRSDLGPSQSGSQGTSAATNPAMFISMRVARSRCR